MSSDKSITAKFGLKDHQYDTLIMVMILNKTETNLANQAYNNIVEG